MMAVRKIALSAGAATFVAVVLVVGAVLVLTRTDWGREQVRGIVLQRLDAATDGEVQIGGVRGDLLRRVVLVDVSIADAEERPFLRADTLVTRFSLRGLFRQRIALRDVRLVNAVVVLDQPPGEEWNYARIFRLGPEPEEPRATGWGRWIVFEDVTLVDGRITVRSEWEPDPDLPPTEREQEIREALADDTRANIQRVPGGFQNVMDFRQLDARVPLVWIAHPDTEVMQFDVAALSGILQPFRPPSAEVHALSGRFRFVRDSVWFEQVQATLPDSRIALDGLYNLDDADLFLRMHGAPVAFADLRWLYPRLPDEGGGSLRLTVHHADRKTAVFAEDADLRVGESRLAGQVGLVVGDTIRLHDTDLRFADFDTRLIEQVAPEVDVPRHGRLTGRLLLAGTPAAVRVDANLAFDDHLGGVSRVVARGAVGVEERWRFDDLFLRFDPLHAELLRVALPDFPVRGRLSGEVTLTGTAAHWTQLRGEVRLDDPATGVSRVVAAGGIAFNDKISFRDLDVRLAPLQAALLREALPDAPIQGTLAGHVRLNGTAAGPLRLDGDLTLRDPRAGTSRVFAAGVVGIGAEAVRFQNLRVRLEPLQLALVERTETALPIGGTLTGHATISGSTATQLEVEGDLVHRDRGEVSRVVGTARFPADRAGSVAANLSLQPVSLATVGRWVPDAGLRGTARGQVRARGTTADLALQMNLQLPEGGVLAVDGWLDIADAEPRYDLTARMQAVNLAAVSVHAPRTSLTGAVEARGRGTDPATMRAELAAELREVEVDAREAERVRLRVALADGLATVDTAVVRLAAGEAEASGSFGMVAGRQGALTYRMEIDSLGLLAPWVPGAEGEVHPRPAVHARDMERARRESARLARAAQVEYAATGRRPPPQRVEAPGAIPRDLLAGRLHAAGTLRGNVERFHLVGRADFEDVLVHGNQARSGWIVHYLRELGTARPDVAVTASLREVRVEGFAFDSIDARVHYQGQRFGTGDAVLMAYQDDRTDIHAHLGFALAPQHNQFQVHDLALRSDTVVWRSMRPGVVRWDDVGIAIETLEVRSNLGGRVWVDGRLPADDPPGLEVAIDHLEIGQVVALMQRGEEVRGRLSLDARVQGTLRDPRFNGAARMVHVFREGRELPDLQATFAYAGESLTAEAGLFRGQLLLAEAEGTLPIDLAIRDREGPRLPERPLALDIRADSLPLDMLSVFTDDVEQVRGRVWGNVAVRGTVHDPTFGGVVHLDAGSLRVVPVGVRFHAVAGTARLREKVVVIDSLVAWSRGPIRLAGEVDVGTLAEPGFDLAVTARGAQVLDNEDGTLDVDADLAVAGPFERIALTGEIRPLRGVLYVPEGDGGDVIALDDPEVFERVEDPALLARRAALVPDAAALLDNLEAEVRIHVGRNLWVRSTDFNVEVYTPAQLGPLVARMAPGTGAMTVEGTLNTDRGEYTFLDRRFRLARGAATFVGGEDLVPLLQVAAEHEIRLPGQEALTIRLVIGGTAQESTVALVSTAEPPVPQTDLISYLAFGRETSSLLQQQGAGVAGRGAATGALVGAAAMLANRQLATVALGTLVDATESEAIRAMGLDLFHITPADLPEELWTNRLVDLLRGTEIEAGRSVVPRLLVAGHARPTLESWPGVRVEYRTEGGFLWRATLEPRFLPSAPALVTDQSPQSTSVFGAFLIRERRF